MPGIQHVVATITLTSGQPLTTEMSVNIPGVETPDTARATLRAAFVALDEAATQLLDQPAPLPQRIPAAPSGARHADPDATAVFAATR